MTRWDDFRQRREIILNRYVYQRRLYASAKYNIILATCLNGLRRFSKYYVEESIRIRARDRIKYTINKNMFRYRRGMRKKGTTFKDRDLKTIKNIFIFTTAALNRQAKFTATRKWLIPFLTEINYRKDLKYKF